MKTRSIFRAKSRVDSGQLIPAFIAGALSVLVFYEGMATILHAVQYGTASVFPIQPSWPFGQPRIWSFVFWGGVWGVVYCLSLAWLNVRINAWLYAVLFGAIAPSLVDWFIAIPMKGGPVGGGWSSQFIMTSLLINGAWGLGTLVFLKF